MAKLLIEAGWSHLVRGMGHAEARCYLFERFLEKTG